MYHTLSITHNRYTRVNTLDLIRSFSYFDGMARYYDRQWLTDHGYL
jgi:hypothetical protein